MIFGRKFIENKNSICYNPINISKQDGANTMALLLKSIVMQVRLDSLTAIRVTIMRKRIYRMVHVYEGNLISGIYKYFMIVIIAMSIIPLTTKEDHFAFGILETFCLVSFAIDYFLRWITADYKFENHSWKAFAKYPFRMISIIDLLSIFALASSIFGWLSDFKLTEALSVFRIVRIFRYSKSVQTILTILKNSKKPLIAVGS
jgi:voltage-gated potassium channel